MGLYLQEKGINVYLRQEEASQRGLPPQGRKSLISYNYKQHTSGEKFREAGKIF
jgi:hypothetical protein